MTLASKWRAGLWVALILAAPAPGFATTYRPAPGDVAVGAVGAYVTASTDTLQDIARHFDLGYAELLAANPGVDPWLPGAGRRIVLPMRHLLPAVPRRGIVVNLGERRLFYFPPGSDAVETFPIGVAVDGRDSPLSTTRVVAKKIDPTWVPPPSIRAERPELPRAIPPGPDNPLGAYALALGWPGYLIHGTNKPAGVGRNVSHGCLHLYPEDIERLFHEVPVGTPVRVLNDAVKVAWAGGALFVEVHPDKAQTDELDNGEKMRTVIPAGLTRRVLALAGKDSARIDWASVVAAGRERTGIPVAVIPSSPDRLARVSTQ